MLLSVDLVIWALKLYGIIRIVTVLSSLKMILIIKKLRIAKTTERLSSSAMLPMKISLKRPVFKKQRKFLSSPGKMQQMQRLPQPAKRFWMKQDGDEVHCHIHFFNPHLSRAFFPLAFFSKIKSRCRMEFFNLYLISGYCIQKLYPPFTKHDVTNGQVHVLILGAGRMGEELITRTVKRWIAQKSGTKITITVIDKAARDKEQYFKSRYPSLSDHCNLKMIESDITSKDFLTGAFLR